MLLILSTPVIALILLVLVSQTINGDFAPAYLLTFVISFILVLLIKFLIKLVRNQKTSVKTPN